MNSFDSCTLEATRFFKKYYDFCKSVDSDSVRDVLFSIYSLDDKLQKCGFSGFHPDKDFLALKALRNYAAHESELFNESRAISTKDVAYIQSQCHTLCLLPVNVIKQIKSKLKSKLTTNAIDDVFIHYSKYVDIYPSIFNFAVKLYFKLDELNIEISSQEYLQLKKSIEYEKINNYDHFISGEVITIDGSSIDDFIERSLINIDEKNIENEKLPVDRDGLRSFVSGRTLTEAESEVLSSPDNIHDFLTDLVEREKVSILPGSKGKITVKRIAETTPFETYFIDMVNVAFSQIT